ncbi:MAG TPA: DHH family phosphoesterase [Phycisphaerae bacterium]|nr:DHH family phosphoesterase [Phycisphaerae bacterium]HNU47028.1 DHH family phosphoesterase [Phycisphaerae bacterium]
MPEKNLHPEANGSTGIRTATTSVPAEVIEFLGRLVRPIYVAHVVPDADALGSTLALARAYAREAGGPRVSLPAGSVSQRLGFLVEWANVQVAAVEEFPPADGFVVLDTAKIERCNVGPALKGTNWSAGRALLNIDHHATNTGFGTVNWAVEAGSTSELVYHLLVAAERPIDAVTASLLYAGMHSDTVGFSLATTSQGALAAAADLVRRGADVGRIGERLCRSQSRSEFELLRTIYGNMQVVGDGQVAYSTASYDEIHGAGCTAADIDEQVNVVRSLEGVRLAMLFTEGTRGKTRINFRGEGRVTVVELAQALGGGGHAQSAGAVLSSPIEETVTRVVPLAIEHLKRFPG